MSVSASPSSSGLPLQGVEGELVTIQIAVEPRQLEQLLETLCEVPFPVNPRICHAGADTHSTRTMVEFPAYAGRLEEVRNVLHQRGFDLEGFRVTRMLDMLLEG
jgi:hypothetical protein